MAGKESKAYQEQKQVHQEDPFMRVMRIKPCQAWAFVEARTQEFLERDDAEADERGGKRMTMEDGDAGERGAEKQKVDQHGEIVRAEIRGDANGHVLSSPSFRRLLSE
jgi:hypothetical protein